MIRLIRILIVGFVLWLLCGAMPGYAVSCAPADAELSATDGFADQLRCERLYNSDFNLTRGAAEISPQLLLRVCVRTADFAARPVLKYGAGCGCNYSTMCASRIFGPEGFFMGGSVVDYYVYRLRRLII